MFLLLPWTFNAELTTAYFSASERFLLRWLSTMAFQRNVRSRNVNFQLVPENSSKLLLFNSVESFKRQKNLANVSKGSQWGCWTCARKTSTFWAISCGLVTGVKSFQLSTNLFSFVNKQDFRHNVKNKINKILGVRKKFGTFLNVVQIDKNKIQPPYSPKFVPILKISS